MDWIVGCGLAWLTVVCGVWGVEMDRMGWDGIEGWG